MDRLPSEILHSLCGLIWETSPQSLHALSLVNTDCYHVAVPFIYRKLTLKILGREHLRSLITVLVDHPLRQQYLIHARQLDVKGKIVPRLTGEEQSIDGNESATDDNSCKDLRSNIYNIDELEPKFEGFFINDDELGDDDDDDAEVSLSSWQPLAYLISRLEFLTDLNYGCVNQFPPCLLDALHRHHPACRLNLHALSFRSLQKLQTDPYKLELIGSPCLNSIIVRHVFCNSRGDEDYNEETVLETIAIAPNLKHVKLLCCRLFTSRELHRHYLLSRAPWPDFVPPQIDKKPMGKLVSLSISQNIFMTVAKFDRWSRHIDVSKLQSLALGCLRDASVLVNATKMAAFASLERLAITLEFAMLGGLGRNQLAAEMFFESLNPLTALRLHGHMNVPLVQSILGKHGCTLQELMLDPYVANPLVPKECMELTSTDILSFASCCPLVEQLHLRIKRSKGDRLETRCYEALGKFPSLEKLSLQLDCSTPRSLPVPSAADGQPDDFDRQRYDLWGREWVSNAHIREALINSAVDEKLARSIWDVICGRKLGRRHLLSLRIEPRGGSSFSGYRLSELEARVQHMSRSFWLTAGSGLHGDNNHIDAVEIGRRARELREERARQADAGMAEKLGDVIGWGDVTGRGHRLSQIFQRIWPPKSENGDWRFDWSSWPCHQPAVSQNKDEEQTNCLLEL